MGEIRRYQHEPAVTDMQERFARALAAGVGQTEAARIAGYADPQVAGVRLVRSPAIRAVIKAMRTNRLDKLASLSLRELEALIKDRKISPAVRFNAIKLSLALAGHTENALPEDANPLNKKDISAMSVDELDAFIASEKAKRAQAAKPIIDHESAHPVANPLKDNGKTEPLQGSALLIEGSAVVVGGLAPSDGDDGPASSAADPTPGG
jgi:phage terminase small subunit